jgi:hypothetical protein
MAGNTARDQAREAESHVNTRQDRNLYLTDGGTWDWDAGLGTLSWNGTIYIRRGGVPLHTILTNNVNNLNLPGDILYVDVNRAAGGVLVALKGTIADVLNSTDTRLILGVRGSDNKLYLRDGTIFSDGDSKTLGTLNAVTDRFDTTANGSAVQNVGFAYVLGSDQLAVYVGGILQTAGVHYTETPSNTQVTFEPSHVPASGEDLSFVNIIGGQGPSGLGNLQDVVVANPVVDMGLASGPVVLHDTGPAFGNAVLAWGVGPTGVDWRGQLFHDGHLFLGGSPSDILLYNTLNGNGIRVKKDGSGLEFGAYGGGFYPAGSWSGNGPLNWYVEQGTLDSAGAGGRHEIATGLSTMVGAILMIDDLSQGINLVSEYGAGTFSTRQHAVMIDNSAQQVEIWGTPTTPSLVGKTDILGAAYTLIIFHQG